MSKLVYFDNWNRNIFLLYDIYLWTKQKKQRLKHKSHKRFTHKIYASGALLYS